MSYLLNDEPAVVGRYERLNVNDRLYSSVVTEAELRYGALRLPGARGRDLSHRIDQLLWRLTDILSITRDVAAVCADLRHRHSVRGRLIPVNDLWIAAIGVSRDLTLVAHDKDFLGIDGLKVEDWLEG